MFCFVYQGYEDLSLGIRKKKQEGGGGGGGVKKASRSQARSLTQCHYQVTIKLAKYVPQMSSSQFQRTRREKYACKIYLFFL